MVVVALAQVRAETFVFRDPERGQVPGKVLAEFEDLLFLALDGEAPRFVSRAELEAVVDDAGTRYDAPPPGTFARVQGGSTPRAAATDLTGEALVRRTDGPLAAEADPAFLHAGDALVTGDAGLARLVLPSGTTAKLAPSSEVQLPARGAAGTGERLDLRQGELLVETALRPLELLLGGVVALRLGGATRAGCEQQPDGARHVLLHDGTAELVWADLRVVLAPGLGAELVASGDGQWRVTADPANVGAVEVRHDAVVEGLAPGASRVFGATAQAEELWRLVRGKGELLVRRGPTGELTPVAPTQRERLALAAGDAVATGPDGEVVLGRVDGAQARLAAGATLEVGQQLDLVRGRVVIEASDSPVSLLTPGGPAAVTMGTLSVTRVGQVEVEAAAVAGALDLPLGASAALTLEPGAVARVRARAGGGNGSGGRGDGANGNGREVEAEVLRGRAVIGSRAHGRGPDTRFRVPLAPGQPVAVSEGPVEGSVGLEGAAEVLPTLHLPGGRALAFLSADVRAEVALDPAWEVVLGRGGRVRVTEGLWVGLATVQGRPELRFKAGPRVRLAHAATVRVHNPRLEVLSPSGATVADIELHGDVAVRVDPPGDIAGAVLALRDDDRFEVPREGTAVVDRDRDLLRVAHGDGRRLWVQDGAPPVQARLADARGTLYVTMPGAPPLGLPSGRPVTVLATRAGELIILADDQLRDAAGLELLTGAPPQGLIDTITRDRARDLLDVPPPDSPSGP
ncbi:MAG: hypothetical protein M9894_22720 [Planctomycetes bacterium]|nr:hypothetical protein [Planctomycetota bacterium]